MIYSFSGRVRYSEIDLEQKIKTTALMDRFQDTAIFHGEAGEARIENLNKEHIAWVVAGYQVKIFEYPRLGDEIISTTWAYGFKHCLGYRQFSCKSPEGKVYALADSQWVLMNMDRQVPIKVPQWLVDAYGNEAQAKLDETFPARKIAEPANMAAKTALRVSEEMIDTNHHVNNGQYIKLAEAHVPRKAYSGLRFEFKKQARLGDTIQPFVCEEDDAVTVALKDDAGETIFIGEWR